MPDWYYARDGQQQGPVSAAQLKQMAGAGELEPDDLVFQEGGKDWVAASTVKGLFPAGGAVKASRAPDPAPARAAARPSTREDDDDLDDDRPKVRRRSSSGGGGMGDILMFRQLIAPVFIIVMFYLYCLGFVLACLFYMYLAIRLMSFSAMAGAGMLLGVLIGLPIGLLVIRVMFEMMLVVFRIHENLVDVRKELERQRK